MIPKKHGGMSAYNGFSGALRAQAQRWLNAQWAAGTLARPTVCCACGQDEGVIDAHAEDYGLPFAAGKTDEFHLCFACHMAVHCRFRNPRAWDAYRRAVAKGARTAPFATRHFPLFLQMFETDWSAPAVPHVWSWARPETWVKEKPLDVIDGWLLANTGKGWR